MKPHGNIRWILLPVLAGGLGYAGIDGASHRAASALFYLFLVVFVVAMTGHLLSRRRPEGDK